MRTASSTVLTTALSGLRRRAYTSRSEPKAMVNFDTRRGVGAAMSAAMEAPRYLALG